jgi:hypothetical protein
MITKNNKFSWLTLLIFLSAYTSVKGQSYESKIGAYSTSTTNGFMNRYYISLEIAVGKLDPSGPKIEMSPGYIIIRGETLYNMLFKDTFSRSNFSNYLLSLMVRGDQLLISKEQLEILKPYLISKSDGEKYSLLSTNKLLSKISKGNFLPDINRTKPSYEDRCVLYNLLNHGITVSIDDESGYLIYGKSQDSTSR